MTSKERVLAAMAHQKPDRVPVDYWASAQVNQTLMEHFGLSDYESLLCKLGVDFRVVRPRYAGPELKDAGGQPVGLFGVRSRGTYSAAVSNVPLKDATTVKEIEDYPFPSPDWYDYSGVVEECKKYSEYAVVGGEWSPFFCTACSMMSMENLLIAMAWYPKVVECLHTKIVDFFYEVSKRQFEAAQGKVARRQEGEGARWQKSKMDIFFMGDDYGMQKGLIMSLEMWRKFIKPHLVKLFDLAKSYGLKVMLHCCGSIVDIIPDLIDIGLDALDPIQVRAAGMRAEHLAREFGKDLVFHGSIDTQQTLPNGTPADVAAEVKSRIEVFGNGFICAPSQVFLPDIPVENIIALYETAVMY
jgi:uroporphyrinogen decarboxylase